MIRFAFLVVLTVAACKPMPPQPPIADADSAAPVEQPEAAPAPQRDAGPDIQLTESQCVQACSVLSWLGCSEGLPTPRGERCAETCQHVQDFPGLALPVAKIISCRDIACARKAGVACR